MLRKEDYLARIGWDEFMFILPNTGRAEASHIAGKILEKFKEPFYMDVYELFVSVSIGSSLYPEDGSDSKMVMNKCSIALYRAKQEGKNSYYSFHSDINPSSMNMFILQNDIHKAIDRGELSLMYQPRTHLGTGKITSIEALVRWNHPTLGVVSPGEFIPIAEENGVIVPLGEWVLRTACQQCKLWYDRGVQHRVAVNFSAKQFLQKDLVERIDTILKETGIPPQLLEIELTETILLKMDSISLSILSQLRAMGITISLDDFGTGYSSLSYLRQLPFDTLKIDKSFVQDIGSGPDCAKQVTFLMSIISMGQSLDMTVVIEGVETEEQLGVLRENSDIEIQGYLLCPPVPANQLMQMLVSG